MSGLHFPAIAGWATPEVLRFVRKCRIQFRASYREIANETDAAFGGVWSPSWNQLAGMDLCELAGVSDESPDMQGQP